MVHSRFPRVCFLLVPFALLGCTEDPPCARGEFGAAECRVISENDGARATLDDVSLRFLPPTDEDSPSWAPLGRFDEGADGLTGRVATLGDFLIRVDLTALESERDLTLRLTNLDARALLTVQEAGLPATETLVPGAGGERELTLPLRFGGDLLVRGSLPCPAVPRLAVLGDIQTGVAQFERVLAALAARREALDDTLVGLIIAGDLADEATEEELVLLRDLFPAGGMPVASTTGNHDTYGPDRDVYNRIFGPANYAFSICGARVALLDTGDAGLAPSVEARLPELFARDPDERLLVGMHYPPYSGRLGNGWTQESQQARVLAELGVARADLALAGHVHSLTQFPSVPVGDHRLHQVIVGTGGADQGAARPRYGWLEVTLGAELSTCFFVVDDGSGEPREAQRGDEPELCTD